MEDTTCNARPCVNKDFFHADVFSCVFPLFILSAKYPKIYGNDENLSSIFRLEPLDTQRGSEKGGVVHGLRELKSKFHGSRELKQTIHE